MKTFLSQAEVCGEKAFKLGLVDPYQMHKRIWETLPHDPNATRDFLFRSDVSNGAVRILLLSERIPISNCNMQWRTTELSPAFLSHGAYRFRLRANPARRCKTYDLERGEAKHRRFALLGKDDVQNWFLRKFSDAGCEIRRIVEEGNKILDLETKPPKRIHFSKGAQNKGVIYSADASGTILVHDEIAFRKAFDAGIGPAKGFGFGLLMLQPVNL
ncbi:MAG: type I-E CRISPR-associated protein Cas6/Cse3/CasE [Kiritimatiellae bacterium]|nr:type I-E CRISPR-associated protein Cas6/Cse3/CasE [Kiritimatiellia bacterium]